MAMFSKEQRRELRDMMKRRWAERRSHQNVIKQGVTAGVHGQSEAAKNADDFADDFNDERGMQWRENRESRRSRRGPARKPVTPPWQEYLTALRSAAQARNGGVSETPVKISYVIDATQCAQSKALVVRSAVHRIKSNGEWGRPNLQETWIRDIELLEEADRKLLALLAGCRSSGSTFSGMDNRHYLRAASYDVLIPALCATGRCFLKPSGGRSDDLMRLDWDGGRPWLLQIHVRRDKAASCYTISATIARNEEQISLAEPAVIAPGILILRDRVARFDDLGAPEWVQLLREIRTLPVPFGAGRKLMMEIAKFPSLPPVELPEEFRFEQRSLSVPPHLKIRAGERKFYGQAMLRCEIEFDYGGVRVPEARPDAAIHDPVADRFFARDRNAEAVALARLAALGFRPADSWGGHRWELPPSRLPAIVRTLSDEGWRVEADGKLYRRGGSFSMQVTSGIDWFELGGQAVFDGETARMPELLKAIRQGEDTVRLSDGSYGLVPKEWLERYRAVAAFGQIGDGRVRFARHQAGLLDALLAQEPEVTFDATYARIREELASFCGVQPVDPPSTFSGQLREYQRDGLGWLHFIRRFGFGGCLADDMGLGKTVQVLAFLDSAGRRGPALIVVPRSLVFNWKEEAARFTPRLSVLDHTGSGRKDRWRDVQQYDIVLTTYGTLRRDITLLKDVPFDTVILDEAQTIKNASTESAKAARLLKAEYRLALTGTPVENCVNDLWSLFEFLNPGMLGSASVFRSHTSSKDHGGAEARLQIVSKALRPFILRRTKEKVALELPAKTEQTIYCELDDTERRLYNELRDHYRKSLLGHIDRVGIQQSRMPILEALLRLRQAACHPGLIDKNRTGETSAKVDTLTAQLAEVMDGGHKVLVFSQFTSLLAILRNKLDREKTVYEYLDGKTRDREGRVRRFQEDASCRLFLISLKAGGLGLNLTAAEYVFLLDPWWNPAVEAQAIDRSHRIGQLRRVFAYRLIARDTVEEKVLQLQKTKRELADAIITADNSFIAGLSRENLELLLS